MKTYKSKIGLELVILLTIVFAWSIYDCISHKKWIAVIVLSIITVFISYLFLKIQYTIEQENLKISCGFLGSQTIDIKTIRKISETYNPISSPAASIDRLEIIYNKFDSVLVSPKDKKGFIENLKEVNPNIEVNYRKR